MSDKSDTKPKVDPKAKVVFDVSLYSLIFFAFASLSFLLSLIVNRPLYQAEANLFANGYDVLQSKSLSLQPGQESQQSYRYYFTKHSMTQKMQWRIVCFRDESAAH